MKFKINIFKNIQIVPIVCQLTFIFFTGSQKLMAQDSFVPWYDQEQQLRYQPEANGFVIRNGKLKFNRSLYGGNSAFRVETGDLPEFALYLPGMGGNMKFGILKGNKAIWLTESQNIKASYSGGRMDYVVRDSILGKDSLTIGVLATYRIEGIIVQIKYSGSEKDISLIWTFGGVTGKRFSRDGDIGADPESVFYLKPEYCTNNEFEIKDNQYIIHYGLGRVKSDNEIYENNWKAIDNENKTPENQFKKQLIGVAPVGTMFKITDAKKLETPYLLINSEKSETPVISGVLSLTDAEKYFMVYVPALKHTIEYDSIDEFFRITDENRKKLANRIKIETPDKYINLFGNTLSVAADAIWEEPSYQHGAVAWRMALPGWRGAYAADWLGWHDRAGIQFAEYAKSQYTSPDSSSNYPDPKTNLSRQLEEEGKSIFTRGYISRKPGQLNKPHHYDMNLVYIDQLLWHFCWTGDTSFMREMWPTIVRHLAWEKRSFDPDGDGLYNAYACIWASDALQYSGGGVTHSTAYNYRSNLLAGKIAEILGKDPGPYKKEAEKIRKAVDSHLWLPKRGVYGEYKDLLGLQQVHTVPALWTIYHAIDEGLADKFKAYQATRFIDTQIPHIPIKASGLSENQYYTLSTSNWMPYTWSINNVALAENLHTSLAYWQSGRNNEAFHLWKSQVIESMFIGSCPGNFQQLSIYDAFRGELYRDFADPIGVAARTLIEGLFGIVSNAFDNFLMICPGFPDEWNFASLETPDFSFKFKRELNQDLYVIIPKLQHQMPLKLKIKAASTNIYPIELNGRNIQWNNVEDAIGAPQIEMNFPYQEKYEIKINLGTRRPEKPILPEYAASGEELSLHFENLEILDVLDPQKALEQIKIKKNSLKCKVSKNFGNRTFFIKVKQDEMKWWMPVNFEIRQPVEIIADKIQGINSLKFNLQNNTNKTINASISLDNGNGKFRKSLLVKANSVSKEIDVPSEFLINGSNRVEIDFRKVHYEKDVINWNNVNHYKNLETLDLSNFFNDKVTNIFKNEYLTPRSPWSTLQIPVQGYGDWCTFNEFPEIEDSGLRKLVGNKDQIETEQGIPFRTPGKNNDKNIIFTSQWDNYPDSILIPLSGNASHIYFLMAGSTHHMQSRFVNGTIKVNYADGSFGLLELKNPETWWPIEQDYFEDDYAFKIDAPHPLRLHLKTGKFTLEKTSVLSRNKTIKIDGGAATVFDIPLEAEKSLKSLELKATANDIIIGLMSITLAR